PVVVVVVEHGGRSLALVQQRLRQRRLSAAGATGHAHNQSLHGSALLLGFDPVQIYTSRRPARIPVGPPVSVRLDPCAVRAHRVSFEQSSGRWLSMDRDSRLCPVPRRDVGLPQRTRPLDSGWSTSSPQSTKPPQSARGPKTETSPHAAPPSGFSWRLRPP